MENFLNTINSLITENLVQTVIVISIVVFLIMGFIFRRNLSELSRINIDLQQQLAVATERHENKDFRIDELNDSLIDRENSIKELQKTVEDSKVELKAQTAVFLMIDLGMSFRNVYSSRVFY